MEDDTKQSYLTMSERIEKVLKEHYEDSEHSDAIREMQLIFRKAIHPEQFCPKCDSQLFAVEGFGYECIECGHQSPDEEVEDRKRPSATKKAKKVNDEGLTEKQKREQQENQKKVEQHINRSTAPTKQGQSIRKLVDQLDSGMGSSANPLDNAVLSKDPNVSGDVNWL